CLHITKAFRWRHWRQQRRELLFCSATSSRTASWALSETIISRSEKSRIFNVKFFGTTSFSRWTAKPSFKGTIGKPPARKPTSSIPPSKANKYDRHAPETPFVCDRLPRDRRKRRGSLAAIPGAGQRRYPDAAPRSAVVAPSVRPESTPGDHPGVSRV